jgi:molybdopterin biosynthesis enzyme
VRLREGADGIPVAHLSGDQGSSMIRALAEADALLIVPVGVADCAPGTVMPAIELT